ncbi:hypothetical protein HYW87_00100 [Candidatus Roizmanbacteria bacterium]|nr:hypothetical protein [Candidatus Roizmanbacteria bacterium]
MKLAATIDDVFGKISPPPGGETFVDPRAGLGKLIATGVRLFLIIAAFVMMLYLFQGAWDWIISGGEKERLEKARNKMSNAIIGMILIVIVFALFGVLTGNVLGIMKFTEGVGWEFNLPTL